MASGITVGLDIGTTSVKGLAVDGDGSVLALARVPHDLVAPSAKVFEHDARRAWVDGPREAIRQVTESLRKLAIMDYDAIAIASMLPSLTAVDADGMPVSPGLLYGDHRGRIGEVAADPLNSAEFRSMLDWTRAQVPDAHGYWTAPAVAGVAIGGVPAIDYGTAFALAPLWTGDWVADELAAIGLRVEQMPLVFADDEVAGHVGSAVQGCGWADAWSEATVSGASAAGDALVICGTTLIVWCIVAEKVEVPGMWVFRHPHAKTRIVAGASNAGAMFINWVRRNVATSSEAAVPDEVPIWVPYLRGERNPIHDASLRGSLHGLDLSHGPAAIRRAAYEATAFVTRRYIDASGSGTTRIVASGGGTHDAEWMQALADCTGRPVDVVAVPEGAALGAAWHARVVAGLDRPEDAGRWARFGQRYEPDPRWIEPCADRYERWLTLA